MGRQANAGFTLVEMLVVTGIIGVLVGLIVPALASFRAQTKSTLCLSNLHQLYVAVETARQLNKDMLPFAAPLPVAEGQLALVPGLPERLKKIVQPRSEVWFCPADDSDDSQSIGTSYIYAPGGFMILELPLLPQPPAVMPTMAAHAERVGRLITQRYINGYLHKFPIMADNDKYHRSGNREPWNVVMLDGEARPAKPDDSNIDLPTSADPTGPNPSDPG